MRIPGRRIAFAVALGATVACSLTVDLSGLSGQGANDTAAPPDAAPDGAGVDVDAVADVAPDVVPPPCKPSMVIDTPLTSTLGTWSPRSYRNAGYPKVATFFGASAAVLFPFVDTTPIPIDAGPDAEGGAFFTPPERESAIGGIWQTTPLALRSFDADFEIQLRCTSASSCADGAAFAWLDTTNVAALTNTNAGGVFGFPASVSGAALVFDSYRNNGSGQSSDPPTPALEVVQLDAKKSLGTYPWVVVSKGTAFAGAWRKVSISLRGDTLTARYEGVVTLTAKVVPVVRGLVGFTSGTGGETNAVAVRNVKASFYDCSP